MRLSGVGNAIGVSGNAIALFMGVDVRGGHREHLAKDGRRTEFVETSAISALPSAPGLIRAMPTVLKLRALFGERGGTRTLDPMIKSHVLYHLSYALT